MMKLYNSLSRKLEEFIPQKANNVSLYVCGITPYDTTHLGHAFTYIWFDVLVRYLTFKGYKVTYTQNVTDINDRDNDILKKALEQQASWRKLGDFWTKKFLGDMKTLNWIMPNNYLKASEQIDSMIRIIKALLNNGFAYQVGGSVYFDIKKKSDFGKLSNFSKNKMLKIAKEFEEDIGNPNKKNPLDFTLWKASLVNQPVHIPSFESPFGLGRPGWHIECSAMATLTLGDQIDIHGGGIDLIYPHHEAEIAESEGATLKIPFARYWMHVALVSYQGKKMAKSLGNLIMISDLRKRFSANAIRFAILSHHYREPWEFEEKELYEAEKILGKLKNAGDDSLELNKFTNFMDNDLQANLVLKNLKRKRFLKILGFKQ
jgi:L-cysteine:1D-myo-inositol 2-amino-2-deoxy-alpha-D-glucopyranoside ligase